MARSSLSQRSLQDAPIFRLLLKVAVKGTHQCDYSNFWGSFGLPTKTKTEAGRTQGQRCGTAAQLSRATPLLPRELRGVHSRHIIQAISVAESGCFSRVGAAWNSQSFSAPLLPHLLVLLACLLLVVRILCIGRLARRSVGRNVDRAAECCRLALRYSSLAE